jgi:sialic acid synthase SpsE
VAAHANANAIKFQLFRYEDVIRPGYECYRKFELPVGWLPRLRDRAHSLGLDFLCTPFAPWAVEELKPFVDAWKIGSFEAERWDLLDALDSRVKIISLGMTKATGRQVPNSILMHCTSRYPTALWDAGLVRLHWLRPPKGFSDHTLDAPAAACAALALGARTIERHIQLMDQPESPDRGSWSLNPNEFANYVSKLRHMVPAIYDSPPEMEAPPGRLVHGR